MIMFTRTHQTEMGKKKKKNRRATYSVQTLITAYLQQVKSLNCAFLPGFFFPFQIRVAKSLRDEPRAYIYSIPKFATASLARFIAFFVIQTRKALNHVTQQRKVQVSRLICAKSDNIHLHVTLEEHLWFSGGFFSRAGLLNMFSNSRLSEVSSKI